MDVYLLVSMLFVFGTIVEFALVLNMDQVLKNRQRYTNSKVFPHDVHLKKTKSKIIQPNPSNFLGGKLQESSHADEKDEIEIFRRLGFTNKVDFVSFIAFNFGYFMFNVIYTIMHSK